jgi:hypothetical protein
VTALPVILSEVAGRVSERISNYENHGAVPRFTHFEILSLHAHPPSLAQNDGGVYVSNPPTSSSWR